MASNSIGISAASLPATAKERIVEGSWPVPESGCWLWASTTNQNGYGCIRFGKHTVRLAHRISYAAHIGDIPDGAMVCHKCDTPSCVNPSHLFLGSAQDNNADRRRKGRYMGVWNGRAKLTEDDVRAIRNAATNMTATGRRYGIDRRTVRDIRRNVLWSHVT